MGVLGLLSTVINLGTSNRAIFQIFFELAKNFGSVTTFSLIVIGVGVVVILVVMLIGEVIRNQREREEQKRRETDDRWRREAAESDEKKFREKQLDLQMQQLEIQKRNSSKPTCDDATAFKVVHDLVIKAQEPVNKLFKKYISSGDCMAAMELAEAVLFSSMLEVLSNAKATGRQFDEEELIQSVLTGSLLEFTKKCGNHQEKQKKK